MLKKILFLSLFFLLSCSTYDEMYEQLFNHYYKHEYEEANKLADEYLESMSKSDDERPLLLLEKASICMAKNNPSEAIKALREADDMTVVLDLTDNPEVVGKYLFSDSSGMYRMQPHEQIQINTFNIISYLQKGDLSGASVEVKRAVSQEKYWVQHENQSYSKNALLQLLGAIVALHQNNHSDYHYFTNKFESMVGKQIANEFFAKKPTDSEKDILVIVLNGKGPVKKPARKRVHGTGVARIITGTGFKGDYLIYPELIRRHNNYNNFNVFLQNSNLGYCYNLLDIEHQAIARFETQKNAIMVAAATRLATRAAISAGAAIATREAVRDKNNDAFANSMGLLVGTIVQASMEAADTPDTRCWTLLPKNILVKRIIGNFGNKTSIGLSGSNYKEIELDSKLKVVIFVIH